ncbi:hypothetical protein EEB13_15190 [Rhodococcus sp. WS3]|uniref:NAD(P)H-dependent amine dehydrogenase family protein n=1 Tax=Rhodococcus sp. WS3 TaxID=2486271 RepID=UPI00114399FB|nr:hypothetical protein [Rhodococcus sp. WS3]ROZ45645.1 hypothetical protein EEB13_15190 [Rhodococcus sp. WS3]
MTIRIIQWATGSIGRVALRHVIDSPELELVGLKVHSPTKMGRDAGDIVRRPATGVLGTDKLEEILALDADVVLHIPLNGESPDQHVGDLEQLLRSGKNVITTVGFTYPRAVDRVRAARLEAAAQAGGVTLMGTGMNPGFMAERLGVLLTGMCTQVNGLSVQETYDCTPVASPGFIYDLCGFGVSEEEYWATASNRREFFGSIFGETLGYLIDTLQLPVDRIEEEHRSVIAEEDVQTAAGPIPAGTVRGVVWQWHAMKDAEKVITVRMVWFAGEPEEGWNDGWQIRIEGAPRVHMDLQWLDPIGLPERSKAVQYATAGPVVRAIPEVVKAAPGILVPPTFATFRGAGAPDSATLLDPAHN